MDNPNVRCNECDWEGYDMELVAATADLSDRLFNRCPYCGSDDIEDTDYDEEE